MGRIPDTLFTDFTDGQTIHASDIIREREIMRVAINDFDDKVNSIVPVSAQESIAKVPVLETQLADIVQVSVKKFGAKNDGTTDNVTSFQALSDYINNSSSDNFEVFFPHGDYLYSGGLFFKKHVKIRGFATLNYTGTGKAIELGDRSLTIANYLTQFTLEGLTFTGGANMSHGIFFNNFVTVTQLNKVSFINFGNANAFGVYFAGNNWDSLMTDCVWHSNGTLKQNWIRVFNNGINSTRLRLISCLGTNQSNIRGVGIWLDGAASEIAHCKIEGFAPNVRLGAFSNYSRIIDTYFETTDNGGCIQYGGISTEPNSDNYTVGLSVEGCFANTHNTDMGTTSHFIEPTTSNAGLQNITLENITIGSSNRELVKLNDSYSQIDNQFKSINGCTGIYTSITKPTKWYGFSTKNGADVTNYGADGTGVNNSTSAIQKVLDSGHGTVIIPDGTFLIDAVTNSNDNPSSGGVSIPSDTTLILSPKAVLKAITNNSDRYAVIRIADATNVKVIGGTIQGERSSHTGTTGEWGYGIIINGSTNVTIEDVYIKDCWSDGIFINGGISSITNPSKSIKVKKVVCDNNRRQGLSVQHVDGLEIEGSSFINTNGIAPQSGIDIEPWVEGSLYAKNIKIIGSDFRGNAGDGIQINTGSSQFTISENTISANGRGISMFNASKGSVIGNIIRGHSDVGINVEASTDITITSNNSGGNKHGIQFVGGSTGNIASNNTCDANLQNGILIAGSSDNVLTNNSCHSNGSQGLYVYASNKNNIANNTVESNEVGLQVSDSNNCQVNGNYLKGNNYEGMKLTTANDNNICSNTILENSSLVNNGSDNFYIFNSSYNNIQSNMIRGGTQANKPTNGLLISDAGSANNIVANNDCYTGGSTKGIQSNGTSTIFGSGNRNNDGTFSITPN